MLVRKTCDAVEVTSVIRPRKAEHSESMLCKHDPSHLSFLSEFMIKFHHSITLGVIVSGTQLNRMLGRGETKRSENHEVFALGVLGR